MRRAARLIACSLLAGCASMAQPEAPAALIEPTPESRAELLQAVTRALQRSDVTLADDALTRTGILLIERTSVHAAADQRLSGREFGKPEQFQLVGRNGRCTLVHQRTGKRYELKRARCMTRSPAAAPTEKRTHERSPYESPSPA